VIDIALSAERDHIGLSVGKLDQSCEVLSRKDHLLYLDTKDDAYELIPRPANMPDFEIAIFFSGLERSLVGSKFNARVDELKSAAYALMAFSGADYGKFADARLRLVPREVFEEHKEKLPKTGGSVRCIFIRNSTASGAARWPGARATLRPTAPVRSRADLAPL
jgi:galactokinase/galacturonokinase